MASLPADDLRVDPNKTYRSEYPLPKPFLARQPFKLLYSTWAILSNTVQLPFFILFYLLPRLRPNPKWSLQTTIVNHIVARALTVMATVHRSTPLYLTPGWEGARLEVIQPSKKAVYVDTCVDQRGVVKPVTLPGTWTPAKPVKGSANKQTVLHFHGGAFIIGDVRDQYSGYTGKVLSKHVAPQVIAGGYRLASNKDGYFPAQLQDAVTWWFHLVDELGIEPHNIVLSGDSAGANLAYQLLRYQELHRDLFPVLPRAILLWSPWVDLTSGFHLDEIPVQPSYKTDYIVPGFPGWGASHMAINYPATDPWLSPLRGVYKTDVPTFIQTGSSEILFPDITNFHQRLVNAKNNVEIHVTENANHDIILLGNYMGFNKQAVAAAEHAKKFIEANPPKKA